MSSEFADSNVLIYAFSRDRRNVPALRLLQTGPTISVQGLNEFVNVGRRKLHLSWSELRDALDSVRALCPTVMEIGIATHEEALRIAERYGYSIYDSMAMASALQAGCETFWSEDLQHGMVIDDRLRIANPFRTED